VDDYGFHGAPAPPTSLVGLLKAGRSPPLSPEAFAARLLAGVADRSLAFTADADVSIVTEQYRLGFVRAWETFGSRTQGRQPVWLEHFGWGDAEGELLLATLTVAAQACTIADGPITIYCLDGNAFSDELLGRLGDANEGAFAGKFRCRSGMRFFEDFPRYTSKSQGTGGKESVCVVC